MSVFFINPFAFASADGDYESIATVTVGSGGASSIEFTSIPGTYQHLQLRLLLRHAGSNKRQSLWVQVNGVTSSSYAGHGIYAAGGSVTSSGGGSQTGFYAGAAAGDTLTASAFGAVIIDVADYASTTKNKTFRSLSGVDGNTEGYIYLDSGLFASTDAITSISLSTSPSNFKQHSTAALYGLKAPA